MKWIISDTNIFISAFNGFKHTIEELKRIDDENVLIPSITVMELYRGMKRKKEMTEMAQKIRFYNIIHFDEKTSQLSIELIHKFSLSHNLQIPDAIIRSHKY